MRTLVIEFEGDDWDDEAEAEEIESAVQKALDDAGIEYKDASIN